MRTPFRIKKTPPGTFLKWIAGVVAVGILLSAIPSSGPAECEDANEIAHNSQVTYCVKEDS
jgi:hypothetical protein